MMTPCRHCPTCGQKIRGSKGALSKREQEVLALAVEGHDNQEIADRLYVCKETVRAHLNTIYKKLGVKTRADLAKWYNGKI
jgi:DNA-binding NarL/FixJ family response regulator